VHREALLRAAARGFGHRLMMDVAVPGGLAVDIAPEGEEALRAAAAALVRDLGELGGLCAPVLRRLEGVGVVPPRLAAAIAPGGPAGRACGRDADLRRAPGYRPYHDLNVAPVREPGGDAAARLRVWLAELRDSARMLRSVLADLPGGEIVASLPMVTGEGFGWAEGPRGDIWTWMRIEGGQVASVFPRDPGWLHLPLLEAAMAGADLEDWAMVRASFGISHAGMDL
jgi:Ni,Fe-hydrogenase III large subunit